MLFGEHAVVYNRPCIVTAVNQRMRSFVEILDKPVFILDAPDVQIVDYNKPLTELGRGDIPKGAKFVEIAVQNFSKQYKIKRGIKVTTASEFSSLFGFGSSSASTVCVIKALSELFNINLSNKQIFDLAYKTVIDIQKKGSGFDVAAAIYGGTLYFKTGGKVIESLRVQNLLLIIGYSGMKADTAAIINQVAKKAKQEPEVVENTYNEIEKIVKEAKEAIIENEWETVGELMNKNQLLLINLGVSTKKLDDMIASSIGAGAYGAKLSGAGGGDCMIALVSENKRQFVSESIKKVGGTVIDVVVNSEGVRTEL